MIEDAYQNKPTRVIPPFTVEAFRANKPDPWYCVVDASGYNVLAFKSRPGAKFVWSKEEAEAIAKEWNK